MVLYHICLIYVNVFSKAVISRVDYEAQMLISSSGGQLPLQHKALTERFAAIQNPCSNFSISWHLFSLLV